MPFEMDLTGNDTSVFSTRKSGQQTHKVADTSYRRNANLYSSIMGPSVRRSTATPLSVLMGTDLNNQS